MSLSASSSGDLRDGRHEKPNGSNGTRRRSDGRPTRSGRPLPKKSSSTNPFDSSSSSDVVECSSSDSDGDFFHECETEHGSASPVHPGAAADEFPVEVGANDDGAVDRGGEKRVAPLDFRLRGSAEAPALRFDGGGGRMRPDETDGSDYISPLEAALARGIASPSSLHGEDDQYAAGGDDEEIDDDDGADHAHEPRGWWSKVVGTFSPTASGATVKERGSSEIVGISDSDEMSFQSAKSIEAALSAESNELLPGTSYAEVSTPTDDLFPDVMAELSGGGDRQSAPTRQQQREDLAGTGPTSGSSRQTAGTPRGKPSQRVKESTESGSRRRTSTKKRKRRKFAPVPSANAEQVVLKEIGAHATDSEFTLDYHSPGTPWTKVIILEEMGTASSWLILLLPYVALIIALALDSVSALQDLKVGPLSGKESCVQSTTLKDSFTFPLVPVPQHSCSYPYRIEKGEGLLSYINRNNAVVDKKYQFFMSDGVAFTSGPIRNVPAMSTFLYGDVSFTNLSSDAVALVTQGTVLASTAVFQRSYRRGQVANDEGAQSIPSNHTLGQGGASSEGNSEGSRSAVEDKEVWFPVSISKPSRLEMVCTYGKHTKTWNCTRPRLVDVLFSLPGTAVLTGGDIRVETIFSHYSDIPRPSDMLHRRRLREERPSSRGSNNRVLKRESTSDEIEDLLFHANLSNPDRLLSELSTSAAYTFEHQRPAYSQLIVIMRLVSLAVSICFLFYWVWRLGFVGFCCATGRNDSPSGCFGSCGLSLFWSRRRQAEEAPLGKRNQGISWWESPWIVMPERRYLFLLLICLLMIQNPLLAAAYYRPVLYSSQTMHVAADCLIGIGVHGILMLTACLMQGLRYHTAAFNRKRAKQQRKVLELQRTARFLADENHPHYGGNAPVSSYTESYYEVYGDVDGSGFAGGLNSRLRHDPCGDGWADFLLGKLILLSVGVVSVIVSAVSRFPGPMAAGRQGPSFHVTAATISREVLNLYKTTYVVSSFTSLTVLILFALNVAWNMFVSGNRLRSEPFLSTRPAQLAFRVLTGIVSLGFMAVVLPVVIESLILLGKWTGKSSHFSSNGPAAQSEVVHNTSSGYYHIEARPSVLEALMRVVAHATVRFPYSGTAASIGPGKIFFVTVCSLVAAFIFLPASSSNDSDTESTESKSQADLDREHQRSDKRHVVTLARYTNSWRVFPLPIKREAVLKQQAVPSKILPPDAFEVDVFGRLSQPKFDRGIMYKGRYMPVFCLEIACWLLEAAWQAYYSHTEFMVNDWAPGRQCLDSVGLKMEAAIHDDTFDTHAFVCSNVCHQVDGEKDSIIVVAFRGTATTTNMRTDLKWTQTPLPDYVTGENEEAAFQIRVGSKHYQVDNDDNADIEAPSVSLVVPRNLDGDGEDTAFAPKALLKATPIARHALPCIHDGFLEAYSNIRQEVLEKVVEVFHSQLNKAVDTGRSKSKHYQPVDTPSLNIPKIYICGHSLGGALGQLLALDLACNCEIVIEQPLPSVPNAPFSYDEHIGTGTPKSSNASFEPKRERSCTQTDDYFQVTERLGATFGADEDSCATPVLKRRNSFPPRHSYREGWQTSDDSVDFVRAMLSGSTANRRKGRPTCLQPPIAVYTFGQPRVGNHAFARLYKQRVPHTFRVVNERDAFTSLPFARCCGGLYKHAGLDVVLDEGCTGNILVGPTVVETLFRFTKMRTNVGAHSMENYRDNLESALSDNELQEYYQGHKGKGGSLTDSSRHGSRLNLPDWVTQVKRSTARE